MCNCVLFHSPGARKGIILDLHHFEIKGDLALVSVYVRDILNETTTRPCLRVLLTAQPSNANKRNSDLLDSNTYLPIIIIQPFSLLGSPKMLAGEVVLSDQYTNSLILVVESGYSLQFYPTNT